MIEVGHALIASLSTGFLVSLLSTYFIIPRLIQKAKERNFVGRDVHKTERIFVSELGGIAIILGLCLGIFSAMATANFYDYLVPETAELQLNLVSLFAAISCILIVFIVGIMDDLFWIRWRTKILLPIIAAMPLMAVRVWNPIITLPFIGATDLGLLFILILIPIAITGATNAMNMIGGYNGSEAGLGLLMSATLLIISIHSMLTNPNSLNTMLLPAMLLIAMIGALIAFLVFNWYPAKIFMGDSGTLQIGAVIASAAIIGNMEKYALLLFTIYFINLVIFAWGRLKHAKLVRFASPDEQGKLVAPESFWKHYLPFTIIHYTKPTEKQLVAYLLSLQTIVCIAVLALYFTGF